MSQQVFFCRHGRVQSGNVVGPRGYEELEIVRGKLEALGFKARFGLSSPADRCVETARFFTYGVAPRVDESLHRYGDFATLAPVADEMLEPLLLGGFPSDAQMVVASHDSMSTVMAFRLIELRGGKVDWTLGGTFPETAGHRLNHWFDQGEGILVRDTSYQLITYKSE